MRNVPRVPYADFFVDSDESFSSDEGEMLKDEKKKTKSRSKKTEDEDEEEWIPEPKPIKPYKSHHFHPISTKRKNTNKRIKFDFPQLATGLIRKNQRSTDDDDIHTSPMGTECQFVPYDKIKGNILHPDKYFPKGCNNINTLLPSYNPAAEDKMQFFGLEGQMALFDMDYIQHLSDTEIDELIDELDAAISNTPSDLKDKFIVVTPYDEDMNQTISIMANVLSFDWADLGRRMQFDVIVMDPPWELQDQKITRGVILGYEQMKYDDIAKMQIHHVQSDGFIFLWVVASMLPVGLTMLDMWEYKVVNCVNWIKTSRKGLYKPSNGHYLQHNKETCLVGVKGKKFDNMVPEKFRDLIVCPRSLRQSHKPVELYDIIEEVFPNGLYLEVFARAHNLREGWVSLGFEVPK